MATPAISLGLLEHFMPFFVIILVFTLMYALLQWTKLFGDSKPIHGVIAFILALFVGVFSQSAKAMFEFLVPWFAILSIFLIFSLMIFKIFGATDSDFRTVIAKHSGLRWTILVVLIILLIGALSSAFGQRMLGITAGSSGTSGSADGLDASADDGRDRVFVEDQVYGPNQGGSGSTATSDINQNVGATFFHPKILGTLFLLIVAAVAIRTITSPMTPEWP